MGAVVSDIRTLAGPADATLAGEARFVVARQNEQGLTDYLAEALDSGLAVEGRTDVEWAASAWRAVRFPSRASAGSRAKRLAGARVELVDIARWGAGHA